MTRPKWRGEYVTTRQASEFLEVHLRTVQRWARDGVLPSYRLRGRLRFRLEDVEALYERRPPATSTNHPPNDPPDDEENTP